MNRSEMIKEENNLSSTYDLKIDNEYKGEKKILELSKENVSKVEACIRYDSKYRKAFDKKAHPNGKYHGSTAYWVNELKLVLNALKFQKKEYEKCIRNIVEAVDRENSTHLNTCINGREEMSKKIIAIDYKKLLEQLRNPQKDNYELVSILKEKMPMSKKKKNGENVERSNYSFATKFCHYMCFYLFEGENEQDNFSIYDGVLEKVIPYYAERYGVSLSLDDSYASYINVIDEIIKKSGGKISRNGFDHLLWYYHKGDYEIQEDDE